MIGIWYWLLVGNSAKAVVWALISLQIQKQKKYTLPLLREDHIEKEHMGSKIVGLIFGNIIY